jgi:hypothetical protein
MPIGVLGMVEHLWIVLTDPDGNGEFLAVNLTGFELYKDATVVLDSGHPFIKKKTVVQYSDAQKFSVSNIDWIIRRGNGMSKEPCSPELLAKVRNGIIDSDDTPQDMQEYLKQRLGKK